MNQGDIEKVVAELSVHHSRQSRLCNELEALADGLPTAVDNQRCLTIARKIFPIVRQAHQFEEQILFPILSSLPSRDEVLDSSLERLRFEHWEDESFAEDLSEALREFGRSNSKENAGKLSYMLRGFFDGLRRHMAFEAEHLVPMLEANVRRDVHLH